MKHIFDEINKIFQETSIYKSVIVYDTKYQHKIGELVSIMKSDDYPIKYLVNPLYESDINIRILVMSSQIFYQWIYYSGFDIHCISAFFLIGNKSKKVISLIKKYRLIKFNDNYSEYNFYL